MAQQGVGSGVDCFQSLEDALQVKVGQFAVTAPLQRRVLGAPGNAPMVGSRTGAS